jgi:hypothetical protein
VPCVNAGSIKGTMTMKITATFPDGPEEDLTAELARMRAAGKRVNPFSPDLSDEIALGRALLERAAAGPNQSTATALLRVVAGMIRDQWELKQHTPHTSVMEIISAEAAMLPLSPRQRTDFLDNVTRRIAGLK